MNAPPQRLAVIGCGLLGASVGLAARRAEVSQVVGFDAGDAATTALEVGAVMSAADSVAEAVAGADLVVIAVPVAAAPDVLREMAEHLADGAVVTDVCSTKRTISAAANGLGVQFVGAHPMAGSERSGPAAARADLFDGRPCFVVRTADGAATARVADFWHSLGCHVRTDVTAADHDRIVARVSHLPHATAAALVLAAGDYDTFAGPGFLDTTRIAAGDADLWAGILTDNADELSAAAGQMRDHLDAIIAAATEGDRDRLRDLLNGAATRRRGLVDAARAFRVSRGSTSRRSSWSTSPKRRPAARRAAATAACVVTNLNREYARLWSRIPMRASRVGSDLAHAGQGLPAADVGSSRGTGQRGTTANQGAAQQKTPRRGGRGSFFGRARGRLLADFHVQAVLVDLARAAGDGADQRGGRGGQDQDQGETLERLHADFLRG